MNLRRRLVELRRKSVRLRRHAWVALRYMTPRRLGSLALAETERLLGRERPRALIFSS